VDACCVSMLGGTQPARLRSYLGDALQDGPLNDGLLQRFQVLVYPDIPQDWRYVDREAISNAQDMYHRLAHLDAAQPLRLRFDRDAQKLFVVTRRRLTPGCLRTCDRPCLRSASKSSPSLAM